MSIKVNRQKSFVAVASDNNSDISDVDSEELAKMVKDVDEMDEALFGLKPSQEDTQKSKIPSEDTISPQPRDTTIKTTTKGFSGDDLLDDISLSDDDFYDIGKKDPSTSKVQGKGNTLIYNKEEDKLAKAKKIANLFGLEDEECKVETKKKEIASDWLGIKDNKKEGASDWLGIKDIKNESASDLLGINENKKGNASDWLGIKDSPVKVAASLVEFSDTLPTNISTSLTKMGLQNTDILPSKVDNKLSSQTNRQAQLKTEVESTNVNKSISDKVKSDFLIPRQRKTTEIFDMLGETYDSCVDKSKEKQSTVLDEFVGGSLKNINNPKRRNSLFGNPPENVNTETSENKDGKEASSQFSLSSGARRPGLGRRRATPSTPPTVAPILFQEDWLTSSSQNELKKETIKIPKSEVKKSEGDSGLLPSWLGGTNTRPQSAKVDPDTSSANNNVNNLQTLIRDNKLLAAHKPLPSADEQSSNVVSELLSSNSEQNQQTALALQRTEAQLQTALDLQMTQSSLGAVCARQRGILDHQERQLAELVSRQTEKQARVERQLANQQRRIDHLLEVLMNNALPLSVEEKIDYNKDQNFLNTPTERQRVDDFEREVHIAKLENEELRQRLKLMEKHYKLEFESYQLQHRREVEALEFQLEKEKEHCDQISEDFKERITQLKERESELMGEQNERVLRLRQERADDLNQLTNYHKMALDQLSAVSKQILSSAAIREEQIKSIPDNIIPLNPVQISEKEENLIKKENMLKALQVKIENEKEASYKELEEVKESLQQEKIKTQETSRQLQHEQLQLKYQLQQLNLERKHMEEHIHVQRKILEEMQEKIMGEQTDITKQKLSLAEEKARLDALANLQGMSSSAPFDVLQAKAEVNGALEAARTVESQAVEERQRLRAKERELDSQKWSLKQAEHDLANKAQNLDKLLQVAENKEEAAFKALEEANLLEKKAEEKLKEVERKKIELREKEQNFMRIKLEIAHEEVRLNRKKEQLEHVLPQLTTEEALSLQPIKGVIDPKMLIMRLRAEREMDAKQAKTIIEN